MLTAASIIKLIEENQCQDFITKDSVNISEMMYCYFLYIDISIPMLILVVKLTMYSLAFKMHRKKAGEYSDRNVVNLATKMIIPVDKYIENDDT